MENSAQSPTALAQAVLSAVVNRDAATLRAIALNEQEFKEHVWPELPAARPERNLPFSYVWGDLRTKSESALSQMLATEGGRHYELLGVKSLEGTTQYGTYLVHRKTELTVKDGAGAVVQLRLFGSVIEKEGRFKIFSYVTD